MENYLWHIIEVNVETEDWIPENGALGTNKKEVTFKEQTFDQTTFYTFLDLVKHVKTALNLPDHLKNLIVDDEEFGDCLKVTYFATVDNTGKVFDPAKEKSGRLVTIELFVDQVKSAKPGKTEIINELLLNAMDTGQKLVASNGHIYIEDRDTAGKNDK